MSLPRYKVSGTGWLCTTDQIVVDWIPICKLDAAQIATLNAVEVIHPWMLAVMLNADQRRDHDATVRLPKELTEL